MPKIKKKRIFLYLKAKNGFQDDSLTLNLYSLHLFQGPTERIPFQYLNLINFRIEYINLIPSTDEMTPERVCLRNPQHYLPRPGGILSVQVIQMHLKRKNIPIAFKDNNLLNRNIIRLIFNLPNSKSIVELMKLIISRLGFR